MDNFIVSARKYRPSTFETVVGQMHITGTLKNAIKNNQLAQAFLFCGPRGVGKTTCARILAKTINCQNLTPEIEACGTCDSCKSFQAGNSFNFHELDAASNNSVDDIRNLIDQVRIPPQAGKYKVYIIDEVHMLSASAFNAFLKTLEEPPPYAIFILATTEKHKILPTILSRCQIFDFNRIKVEDIALHLEKIATRENISFEKDGLHIIAQKADGGLRDALSMFDQIVSFTNKEVTYKSVIANLNILNYDYYFKLVDFLTAQDISSALILFDEVLNNGFDGNHFINGLASHLRNLLVGKDPQTLQLLEVSDNIKTRYIEQSKSTSLSFILTALNLANQCDLIYKNSKNQRLQVEMALIKMAHIQNAVHLAQGGFNNVSSSNAEADKKKTPELTKIEKINAVEAPTTNENKTPVKEVNPTGPSKEIEEKPTIHQLKDSIPLKPIQKKTSKLIPSLKDLEALSESNSEKEPTFLEGSDVEPFSFESFLIHWNSYAEKAKKNGRINIYTLLTSQPPELKNEIEIHISLDSKYQDDILKEETIDLLNYLRAELKNFNIVLKSNISPKKRTKKYYTSIEKYQYMVEKNPKLEEMRVKFNLDLLP